MEAIHESMSRIAAIRKYFERDGGRKLSMDELRMLTTQDRHELGQLAARELGVTLDQ